MVMPDPRVGGVSVFSIQKLTYLGGFYCLYYWVFYGKKRSGFNIEIKCDISGH